MAGFLLFGILFLDLLLNLVHFLAQLRKILCCGIEFLSTILGGMQVRFFQSVFLIPTTILGIVHGI